MSRSSWFNMPRDRTDSPRYYQDFGTRQYWAMADAEHRAGRMLGMVQSWRESRRRFPSDPRAIEPANPSPPGRPLALLAAAEMRAPGHGPRLTLLAHTVP